ncbi:MAG: protein kinase [Candidatus Acidiferrales bacterium]
MTQNSGSRVGPYEILAAIGAGGMGEVYRARDAKLGRDVALKVLPEAFARDAERMARFQREAKVLASLNHSNIASIYGLEDSGATHALVMELVEGPTLADRIKQGPIPIEEAVLMAKQIAQGLEYAHERGIVHRDLKPANIKVSRDDSVKILDFGLAKAVEGEAVETDMGTSPTLTRMATQAGFIIGTAAYMSPEQAKGKPVDRRADIWAFGCVFYEMLTGKMAFSGETVTDTLAAVVMKDADWTQLPKQTPLRVRVLLQRCLQKDPKQRLRDIGDARISIDEVLLGALEPSSSAAAVAPVSAPFWRRALPWAAGILAVALASLAAWNLKPSPAAPVVRAVLTLPAGQRLAGLDAPALALSADGSELAYVATTQGSASPQIFLRSMDSTDVRPIPGTEGAANPFFSPDGQWLGFFADRKLKKISVSGGAAQALADVSIPLGASWSSQGTIAFANFFAGFLEVPDAGGTTKPMTHFEKADISQGWPDFLPGGRAVLFAASPDTADWTNSRVEVELVGAAELRNLLPGQTGTMPRYARPGCLIFAQAGNLMAAPFDPERLEVKGAAVPVVQGVLQSPTTGSAQYSLSATGSLVYVPGGVQGEQSDLVWVSRNGTELQNRLPTIASHLDYDSEPRFSPDGSQIVFVDRSGGPYGELEAVNLASGKVRVLTNDNALALSPVWSPDGRFIYFASSRGGTVNIWEIPATGGEAQQITAGQGDDAQLDVSSDGKRLVFSTWRENTNVAQLDLVAQPGLEPAKLLAPDPARSQVAAVYSPDGKYLAHFSNLKGAENESIWLSNADGSNPVQLVRDSRVDVFPHWTADSQRLIYLSYPDEYRSVSISGGAPETVLKLGRLTDAYFDVGPDGRLLFRNSTGQVQIFVHAIRRQKRTISFTRAHCRSRCAGHPMDNRSHMWLPRAEKAIRLRDSGSRISRARRAKSFADGWKRMPAARTTSST